MQILVKDVLLPVFYFMKTRSIKMYGPNRRLHGREDLYVFSLVVYYSITNLLILLLLLARPAPDTNK